MKEEKKKTVDAGEEMAEEMEKEENEAGTKQDMGRMSKDDVHKISENLKPAGQMQVSQETPAVSNNTQPTLSNVQSALPAPPLPQAPEIK